MIHFFTYGGPYMWIHLIIAVVILTIAVKNFIILFIQKNLDTDRTIYSIHSLLFWGIFSAVLGFFAHYMGLYQSMQVISTASDISPFIIAEGFAVSMITILTGLFTLLISSLLWMILHWKYRSLKSEA